MYFIENGLQEIYTYSRNTEFIFKLLNGDTSFNIYKCKLNQIFYF